MTDHKMPKPKSGGKPKRITTKNPPGGPKTPGAKGTYKISKPRKKSSRGK